MSFAIRKEGLHYKVRLNARYRRKTRRDWQGIERPRSGDILYLVNTFNPPDHVPVDRWVTPEEFEDWKAS